MHVFVLTRRSYNDAARASVPQKMFTILQRQAETYAATNAGPCHPGWDRFVLRATLLLRAPPEACA